MKALLVFSWSATQSWDSSWVGSVGAADHVILPWNTSTLSVTQIVHEVELHLPGIFGAVLHAYSWWVLHDIETNSGAPLAHDVGPIGPLDVCSSGGLSWVFGSKEIVEHNAGFDDASGLLWKHLKLMVQNAEAVDQNAKGILHTASGP